MMIETIKNLAHELQEVCAWSPENEPIPDAHVTQIMQTALNMPTALGSGMGKGTFMFVPHRAPGGLEKFQEGVLRKHPGCNIDTTFNHCTTVIVFGICQEEPDEDYFPADQIGNPRVQQRQAIEKEWFSKSVERMSQYGHSPLGNELPYFLKNQIVCHSLALSAAALECRRLGYHVQFLTLDRLAGHFYREYPDIVGRPFIPMHCILTGTKPSLVKMSHRRNRGYKWAKDSDFLVRPDDITMDQELHYPYDNFRLTPNDHEPLRNTYKPVY
jgi:hypothetical protein